MSFLNVHKRNILERIPINKRDITPGDIVYSSTNFLEINQPNISIEKLITVMNSANISFGYLNSIIEKFKNVKVHVVGDTIIDSQTQTSLIGGQTISPTISVMYETKESFLGGAAVVARHLRAAGSKVEFTTVLGNDTFSKKVISDLKG